MNIIGVDYARPGDDRSVGQAIHNISLRLQGDRRLYDSWFITEILEKNPGWRITRYCDYGIQLDEDGSQVVQSRWTLERI